MIKIKNSKTFIMAALFIFPAIGLFSSDAFCDLDFQFKSYSSLEGKFTPPEGKVLLIVGQDKRSIDSYVKHIGIVPGGVSVYTSIQDMSGLREPFDNGAGIHHAQYLMDKYPKSVVHLGLYMVDGLEGVLSGRYESNLEKLGNFFNEHKRPFFLRIGYEFDNPENNYEPGQYTRAYRRIVDTLRGMGVDNVAYVWHSYASSRDHNLMDWYPGDKYVDWFAISYFNPYNDENMNEVASIARLYDKPLMIAESTPNNIGTKKGKESWDKWFRFVFKYIEENDVRIFAYINCSWDGLPQFRDLGWGEARLEVNRIVKENWINTVKDEKFLHASEELFQLLKYEQK